jgi:hypothetical protein
MSLNTDQKVALASEIKHKLALFADSRLMRKILSAGVIEEGIEAAMQHKCFQPPESS